MQCPKCQFENREEADFCRNCGQILVGDISCPKCEASNPPDSKFCEKCGQELKRPEAGSHNKFSEPQSYTPKFLADKIFNSRSSIEGERKTVTVLFADIANFTTISEKLDPEEVHEVMDGCFKILMDEIHKYEGTINQFTGDGVMALFGAPVAHEDHAQRACRASVAIQKALIPYSDSLRNDKDIDFKMRIGLNSGPVVVASIGDDLRMDYTAVGDTTNLAARMETLANPGTVLASQSTYKIARSYFEFKPLGKVRVKGKKVSQEVYEVQRVGEVETRIGAAAARGLSKFVGRSREMIELHKAFKKTHSGSGQVIGLVGEAGSGKSRLLIEFRKMLDGKNVAYYEGRCSHYGGSIPYLPILDILKSFFNLDAGDGESNVKSKIETKILKLDERPKIVLSPFHDLLSLEIENEEYLQLDSGLKRLKTFEAIRDLLTRESQNRRLIIAVEDLQWIDKTSEEFLGYLIDWLTNTQILLILLYRPEYAYPWAGNSLYNEIAIDQLSSTSSSALVEGILEGGPVVPELNALILSKAGGNPLFVEEFTRILLENGFIQRKGKKYLLYRRKSEIEVPETIQAIIAARIDRVEESLKQILQVASAIGREFPFRILQAISGKGKELKSALSNLQALGFITEKKGIPEQEYMFKHALIQEVAYNSLLHRRKKKLHEKIGKTIEEIYPERIEEYCELLAYHYAHSDNKDKALEYLCAANRKGIKLNAMEEARAYFDESMRIYESLPESETSRQERVSLLVKQRDVFLLTSKIPEYHELLIRHESMAGKANCNGTLGAFYERLGLCLWWSGNFEKVIHIDARAAQLCEAAGNAEDAGYAYAAMSYSHFQKGDFDQAFIFKEKALRKMEQQFNPRCYGFLLLVSPFVYFFLGRWDDAVREGRKLMTFGEDNSNDSFLSYGAWCISMVYSYKCNFAQAIKYAEFAIQKAPNPTDKFWAQDLLALALYRSGEITQGIEIFTGQIPIYHAVGYAWTEIIDRMWLCEAYKLNGEYGKARQTLLEGLRLARRCGTKFFIGMGCRLMGELDLQNDPSEASAHFEKSIAICRKIKAENELALAYAGFGRLHKIRGNIARAREYLKKSLVIFERLGTLVEPDKVKDELTLLPEF